MRTLLLITLFSFTSASAYAWDQSCIDDCLYNKLQSPKACNAQCGVPQQPQYQIQQNLENQALQQAAAGPTCINRCVQAGNGLSQCIDKCQ